MTVNEHPTILTPAPEHGRILALDLGASQTGVAICDETQTAVRRVETIERMSWKNFVRRVAQICQDFDAQAVVVGLPLSMDGSPGTSAQHALRVQRNLSLSLNIPVYVQDERLTSLAAAAELRTEGLSTPQIQREIHKQSAVIILRDFLLSNENLRVLSASKV